MRVEVTVTDLDAAQTRELVAQLRRTDRIIREGEPRVCVTLADPDGEDVHGELTARGFITTFTILRSIPDASEMVREILGLDQ